MDIQVFSYGGKSFRVSDQGVGQALIFVGGAFQALDKLGPLSDHWRQHYRLILIELPGFGDSDFLPESYSFDFTAECIAHVVRTLAVPNPVVVGTSYGSPSVYRYVGTHQNEVKAMVLGGSCTSIDRMMEYQIRLMLWIIKSQKVALFPKAFTEVMCNTKELAIPNAPRIHQILIRSLARMDSDAQEKFIANSLRLIGAKMPDYNIAVPSLVFTGEHDQFTRADRLSEFSKYCWDLRIVRIPNCDHMYHLEQTGATLALIDRFVDSLADTELPIAV